LQFNDPYPLDAEYFKRIRTDRKDERAELEANLRPHEIIVPGHEVDPKEVLPLTAKGLFMRRGILAQTYVDAFNAGFEVKIGQSTYYTGDKIQANGKLVTGKEATWTWIEGVKDRRHFTWNDDGAIIDGKRATTAELKQFINEGEDDDTE
jgi:hypothetical protein